MQRLYFLPGVHDTSVDEVALLDIASALGVVLGNRGDLRTGLPAQSVHAADGGWYHEPVWLQMVVEAPPDKIQAVLSAQSGVMELVENGRARLFALDPASPGASLWVSGRGWVRAAESVPIVDRRGRANRR